MGKTVYDIDAAIERRRSFVKLRGDKYEIRDITVRERLEKQTAAQEKGEDEEEVRALLAQGMLKGLPDDLASSLTHTEFALINRAFDNFYNVDSIDFDEDEVKNV